MNYKVFREFSNGKSNISVDKIDESLGYYEYISAQESKGKRQVIMTTDYLLHVAEGLSSEYSVKAIEVDVDDKYKQLIGKMLKMVNDDKTTYEILRLALIGMLEEEKEDNIGIRALLNIGIKALLLDNGEHIIELRVNGLIKFTEEPSKTLKDKIAQLTEEKDNQS